MTEREASDISQFQQVNTTMASMHFALIQKLVMRGLLPGSEAAELFRDAQKVLSEGPSQGQIVSAGVEALGRLASWSEAAKRQGQ